MHSRMAMRGGAYLLGDVGREQVIVRDLSERGIGIESDRQPRPGESLRVMLSLDRKRWVDLRGVVRHSRPEQGRYFWGIELSGSDVAALGELEAYMRRARARVPAAVPKASTETGRHRMVRDATGKLQAVTSMIKPKAVYRSPAPPAPGGKKVTLAARSNNPPPTPRPIPAAQAPAPAPAGARRKHHDSAELRSLYAKALSELDPKKK